MNIILRDYLIKRRWAISTIFFIYGLTFSSWAARIPTIQQKFDLSEAGLGSLLLALPIGSFLSLPIAGFLVAKFSSKLVTIVSILAYIFSFLLIPIVDSVFLLGVNLFLLGFTGNTVKIAINTQAVALEKLYERPILAAFHGMWSLAGFGGATFGALMIAFDTSILIHYSIVFVFNILLAILVFRKLLESDKTGTAVNQSIFSVPDKSLLLLGFIAFCSMLIEGTMFDWSGVYFKTIVQASIQWVGTGYVAFMISMATMRFFADKITAIYGAKVIIMISGTLSFLGLAIAILFPMLISSLTGFLIVGMGVSSVIPLVFGMAGSTNKMAPSVALASVSTMGFIGFLIGPPLVGFMAEVFGLQISFALIALMGLMIVLFGSRLKSA